MFLNSNDKNTYKLKPIQDMTDEHLCNTITCYNPNITNERKQECKVELVRRWTMPQRGITSDSIIEKVLKTYQ